MRTIEQLLGDLLLRHNCVIVPGFGGFVAKQVSAKVDFNSGKMFPPSKSLLFNKQLINNDGLLINEYAQSNGLAYDDAQKHIDAKVGEWNRQLHSGGRIELDRIGYLFFDAEKNLCFEQDRFFNLLLESFGLGQVHFLTEEDVKIVESVVSVSEPELVVENEIIEPVVVKESKTVNTPIIPIQKEEKEEVKHVAVIKPKRKVWRYVAAACILPIAFYAVWIPMKTDVLESGVLSITDFNPFHTQTESVYEQQELEVAASEEDQESLEEQIADLDADVDTYTYAYDDDTNISVALETESTSESVSDPVDEVPAQESFEANAMHFIVGCFGDKSNATNLVAKLKAEGLDGRIVDVKNGLHRVSAGSALSIEAFAQVKSTVKGMGYTGWTLK